MSFSAANVAHLDSVFRAEVERLTSQAAVAYQLCHATGFGLAGFVASAAGVTSHVEKKVGGIFLK